MFIEFVAKMGWFSRNAFAGSNSSQRASERGEKAHNLAASEGPPPQTAMQAVDKAILFTF